MDIDGVISAIIIGAIIGALARLVMPGRQKIGILLTIVVGIIAALIGTFIARAVGVETTSGIDWIELLFQIVLAVVGVGIVSGIKGGSRART